MRVDFLGVRGSVCAPGQDFVRYGGNTSCVVVRADGDAAPALLLDAGTGIRTVTAMLGGAPFRPRAAGRGATSSPRRCRRPPSPSRLKA